VALKHTRVPVLQEGVTGEVDGEASKEAASKEGVDKRAQVAASQVDMEVVQEAEVVASWKEAAAQEGADAVAPKGEVFACM
jgi:hypothetical protein